VDNVLAGFEAYFAETEHAKICTQFNIIRLESWVQSLHSKMKAIFWARLKTESFHSNNTTNLQQIIPLPAHLAPPLQISIFSHPNYHQE